jgi:hypothetical protein
MQQLQISSSNFDGGTSTNGRYAGSTSHDYGGSGQVQQINLGI